MSVDDIQNEETRLFRYNDTVGQHWKYPLTVGNDTSVDDINFNSHESSEYAKHRMSAIDGSTQEPFMMFEMMTINQEILDDKNTKMEDSIKSWVSNDSVIPQDTRNVEETVEFTQNFFSMETLSQVGKDIKDWILESVTPAPRQYTGSIALYMPTDIQINDSMIYNEDTRKLGANLAGMLSGNADLLNLSVITDPAVLALTGAAAGMIPGVPQAALTLLGGAVGVVAQTEVQRHSGQVMNPNELVKYQQTALRTFTFNWTFLPDSEDESKQAAGIIKFFRKSAHAKKQNATLVTVPDHVITSFHGAGGKDVEMIQLPPCFIESVNVTYNPNNTSFFKRNNAPVEIGLSVGLKEIVPIYAADVERGL